MAAVKSKDTGPELLVRRLVHSLGYRYRLHVRSLPGTPDLVSSRLRKIINVNGCFWHMHTCNRCRVPSSRGEATGLPDGAMLPGTSEPGESCGRAVGG